MRQAVIAAKGGIGMIDLPTDSVIKAVVAKNKNIDKCDLCIFQKLKVRCSDFYCSKEQRKDYKDVYFDLFTTRRIKNERN